ncbi:DUF4174 domain-containing protein [Rhodalgimonas zhirmunskyi]|uniref:DUF4174 domain-containing protein n=1 Tax=Rhodalgimonas zhirmunskyi TaxID=2964767 RepID=A0AAJ1X3V5_9RHOB|nr:DUF4174 domain-containing protein [Rhodoalgimonas zhirmunskyi]MDQ2092886.1 DUF4174 domain-containing protein [Rhodoalgimonas zhirmunskyi]
MKPLIALIAAFITINAASAQTGAQAVPARGLALLEPEAESAQEIVDLKQFLWKKRVLVVFADSPGDPRFIEQLALLGTRTEDLAERDVVLLIDTDPDAKSALREKFRPHGFIFLLLGKDGSVYLRKPSPWDVREISRSIDKMPMRRQELRSK